MISSKAMHKGRQWIVLRAVTHAWIVSAVVSTTLKAQATTQEIAQRFDRLEQLVNKLTAQITELNSLVRPLLPRPPVVETEGVTVDIRNSAAKGEPSARVALIEYSDFECPFCRQHAATTYRAIQRAFVETGKIKYVFRHLPLEQIHPAARKAAEASECAFEQQRFWEYHDRLFENQKSFTTADLEGHANALQLDIDRFRACHSTEKVSASVSAHVAEARRLGLTGTPAFLIGEIQKDGTVRVSRKLAGAQPFAIFQGALDDFIGKLEQ